MLQIFFPGREQNYAITIVLSMLLGVPLLVLGFVLGDSDLTALIGFHYLGLLCLLFFFMIVVAGLLKGTFGRELILAPVGCIVDATPAPDCNGNAEIVTLPLTEAHSLSHFIYHHPSCSKAIVDWLAKQLSVERGGEQGRFPS